ncbi:hypothetical protein SAMN06298221_102106 [Sphaerochaeta associata]|uniref:Uncharacterized protein n=1 Tax=Sphaerochaeta associata TaxID=1129264 RepID=A0ABY4D963_9SPIR|nr:hypothetical protein [Sphaerochaeta associata]UOM50377.1 hypothetical protein MUG09_12515 [Sphaerochaeta associata]SMP42301.1 hypothetical protein SAMN06298221_102106 [Sphaerochaeta associata]
MNKRWLLPILLVILLFTAGCQSYTARQGKSAITIPAADEVQVVTKYSTLEAERQAILEAELARQEFEQEAEAARVKAEQEALRAQQQREVEERRLLEQQQLEQSRQQAWDEAQATIASLTEKNALLEQSKKDLESRLDTTLQALAASKGESGSTSEQLVSTMQQLDDLTQAYQTLTYHANELEGLLTEQQVINRELQRVLAENEEARLANESSMQSQHALEVQILQATIQNLGEEMAILKIQLEEKASTLEEKLRLEQEREAEAKRLAEQKQQELAQREAEQQRLEEEERIREAALQAQYRQIPPLASLTFPRVYATDTPTILLTDQSQLHVMLLPLDDTPWSEKGMALEVKNSIKDLSYPVIFLTGHMQNVIDVVREIGVHAVLVDGGAIITTLPIVSSSKHGASVQFSEKKTLRLALSYLPEYEVLSTFASGGDWKAIQKEITGSRQEKLKAIIGEGSITEPTLIASSLFEPSHQDWNTFSPITYRQVDYLWPLTTLLEDEQFYDAYRATHFSSATDAGNTFLKGNLKERIDYLFSRKLLPLSSSMLTIGGESVADANGIARYGLVASFLVP